MCFGFIDQSQISCIFKIVHGHSHIMLQMCAYIREIAEEHQKNDFGVGCMLGEV